MNATGFCPRCGYGVGTIHSKPECDANYDHAYKRRMADLTTGVRPEATRVRVFIDGRELAS